MGGARREARSAVALAFTDDRSVVQTASSCGVVLRLNRSPCGALASARTCRCATPHPASAKLTAFAKPQHPSPARGEGDPFLREWRKRRRIPSPVAEESWSHEPHLRYIFCR